MLLPIRSENTDGRSNELSGSVGVFAVGIGFGAMNFKHDIHSLGHPSECGEALSVSGYGAASAHIEGGLITDADEERAAGRRTHFAASQ